MMAFKGLDGDNLQFRLFYRYTVFLLILFSGLIYMDVVWTSGSPIVCGSQVPVDEPFINNCWRFGLYRPPASEGEPKLENSRIKFSDLNKLSGTYHYTMIFLLLQALLFFLPRCIWYTLENNTLVELLNKLNRPKRLIIIDSRFSAGKLFFDRHKSGQNTRYYWKFVHCELWNFINCIVQAFAISYLLDFNFFTYGVRYFKDANHDKFKNLDFPIYSYCKMPEYGKANGIGSNFGVCIIAINEINARVYLILWAWFALIGMVSICTLSWRLIMASFPSCFKKSMFKRDIKRRFQERTKQAEYLFFSPDSLPINWHLFEQYCKVGDMFVLKQILKNVSNIKLYHYFLLELSICFQREYGRTERLEDESSV